MSLGSSETLIFNVVDLLAGFTVVVFTNILRVKFGLRLRNSLEEIENPSTLLIIELVRFRLHPTAEKTLGYALVWMVVVNCWLFEEVFA